MKFLSIILCFALHSLITSATSANSSHASSSESCKLRGKWRSRLTPSWFDPTQDCLGLSKILETVNRNHHFNFCAADPDVVLAYINSSLSSVQDGIRPKPCEVRQWYYGTYGGKMKKPFCQNATEINLQVYKSKKPDAARTEPYLTVFHGPRSSCARKFTSDLKSIGDPDLAGIGVLFSQVTGMALLCFFNLAAHAAIRFPIMFNFLKSVLKWTRQFYAIATLLSFSTATAALATFLQRHSKTKALHKDFGYSDFYVNLMLVLAPALSVTSVVVLVLMPPNVTNKGTGEDLKLWDKEKDKNTKLLMWTIWGVGVYGQQNPTRIVFGGAMNVRVSSFISKHGSTYISLVCILMTVLPVIGMAVLGILWVWYRTDDQRKDQSLSILRDTCRNVFLLFGIVQLTMAAYIRSQSIQQAQAATSEMQWGFV
ncbi:hypothetical protein E8E13_002791 [Curvularia kusanoi]|uniref:Uncharacterized protein n=1 Tax=Curvularia kusanoi TaxID=90978 RepID=A0A9P4T3S2_CURKU|nr:hypothetical protein E8E13_002791 [Curvularia kusanoi]